MNSSRGISRPCGSTGTCTTPSTRCWGTRAIANPHGYSRVEGHSFNPALVLDV